MQKTVIVYGTPFEVEFNGEPFIPARRVGLDDFMPAEGGEAEIETILLEGHDLTNLLSDHVLNLILQDLTQYLCSGQAEEEAKAVIAEARREVEHG